MMWGRNKHCGGTIELAVKSCGLRLYQRIGEHKIGDSSEMVPRTCGLGPCQLLASHLNNMIQCHIKYISYDASLCLLHVPRHEWHQSIKLVPR